MSELAYQEISYDERIVAFVDILGWSNAVVGQCACPSAEIGWLVHLFQRSVQQAAGHRNFYAKLRGFPGITDDVEVSQFSDSIAISVPIGNGQWVLEEQLRILTDTACQNGFLLRGGIAKGELFHQGSMLFGPALIAAVNMEKAANYPRIILHPSLHDQFHQGSVLLESNGAAYGRRKTWRTDHDGSVFFDYMQPFNAQEIFPDSGRPAWTPSINMLTNYKHLICLGLVDFRSELRVYLKYCWAKDYFIRVASEYPSLNLQPAIIEKDGMHWAFETQAWPK